MGGRREEGGEGGRGGCKNNVNEFTKFPLQPIQIPNKKTTNENDISKKHSQQVKAGKVEINYKIFANPVFINPGTK